MLLIYSTGGYSREFSRIVKENYSDEKIQLVDDNPTGNAINYKAALENYGGSKARFIIGFADTRLRHQKTKQVLADGFKFCSLRAKTCIIGDNVKIEEGHILSDFSILTADSQIGHSFQCNIYSYVAHDCIIGDFVTFAPRVSVNGRVEIGNHVYIGTGATILPGVKGNPICIGDGAVIGAHALVTKNVPENTTVIGSPAKPLGNK